MNTVSILKACDIAGVSRRTMYNWMNRDIVQFIRTPSGSRRVLVDSLFKKGNVEPVSREVQP